MLHAPPPQGWRKKKQRATPHAPVRAHGFAKRRSALAHRSPPSPPLHDDFMMERALPADARPTSPTAPVATPLATASPLPVNDEGANAASPEQPSAPPPSPIFLLCTEAVSPEPWQWPTPEEEAVGEEAVDEREEERPEGQVSEPASQDEESHLWSEAQAKAESDYGENSELAEIHA